MTVAAWCKSCKTIHPVDGPHTRPQPIPKDAAYAAPETMAAPGAYKTPKVGSSHVDDLATAMALADEVAKLKAEVEHYKAESNRWGRRVKLLEERNERAAKILRGEG